MKLLLFLTLAFLATIRADIAQQAYLKASNPDANDEFGRSVAIYGDTLVIGAPNEDSTATGGQANNGAGNAGAVYVFVKNGGNWTQQAYLKASNAGAGDQFGSAVALEGDTLIVGAQGEDSNDSGINHTLNVGADDLEADAGAAYIFVRNGTTWTQQAYLKSSSPDPGDLLGISVGISGNTVVVGARDDDGLATNAGAAYIYVRNGSTWSQQQIVRASNGGSSNRFGASVAISGDTIVSGAYGHDGGVTNAGAAYVFTRGGTTWSEQDYLLASNRTAEDLFGINVAISNETILVGARHEDSGATGVNGSGLDNSATDSGAAYVFTRSSTAWSQQAYLKASNTGTGDHFGRGLAIEGDTIVIGAPLEQSNAKGVNGLQTDNSADDAGAAYVFTRTSSIWTQTDYLKASNTEASDNFGWPGAVAISGSCIAVGSPLEDSSAVGTNGVQNDNNLSNSGAAYLFEINPAPPQLTVEAPAGSTLTSGGGVIDFGSVPVGPNGVVRTVTLRNTGGKPLSGISASVSGISPPDSVVIDSSGMATTLAAGYSTTFAVRFATRLAGESSAQLTINHGENGGTPFTCLLEANGVASSPAPAQTIALPQVPVKQSSAAPFSIATYATSGLPVTYQVVTGPAIVAPDGIVTLTGGEGTVTIRIRQDGGSGFDGAEEYLTFQVTHAGGFVKVSTGVSHSAGIREDGTLWAWGSNQYGQLGDGTNTSRVRPVRISTADGWTSVSCGGFHTVALRADGTLWTWGYNINGQLGDGTTSNSSVPTQVGSATAWSSASGGGNHTVALRSDGTLWAWGSNVAGQLGNGATTDRTSPVQIGSATTWTSVAAGGLHTVALRGNGTLWAWGFNLYGQLGDGTTTQRNSPVQIGSTTTWSSVASGNYHTLALRTNGTLWAW
jgi:hypothetical protein